MKDEYVLNDLKQRKSGKVKMTVGGKSATVYYGPIRNIEWAVAVIVPQQNIEKPVILAGVTLLAVVALGILVVWLVLFKRKNDAEET